MKKLILLFAACVLLSLPVQARKVFLTMIFGDNTILYNQTAALDDGCTTYFHLKDESGRKIEFKSEVGALN
ncbi:MAG: hypothetical protein K2M12_09490, partial [Muribaculaceae bacterium]|nr:hypothetical protein [Muribaculaceae bacterium]